MLSWFSLAGRFKTKHHPTEVKDVESAPYCEKNIGLWNINRLKKKHCNLLNSVVVAVGQLS